MPQREDVSPERMDYYRQPVSPRYSDKKKSVGEEMTLDVPAPHTMEGPVLVLWALLGAWGAGLLQRGPRAAPPGFAGSTAQPGRTLTCFRCFKVTRKELCTPTTCSSTDRVCVSHEVTFFRAEARTKVLLSKRCAPQCPNTNMVYEWPSGTEMRNRITRQCCNQSLCNAAAPALGRPWALPGVLLLPLGLGLLGALP
ncbi:lymphocyte antigen 6L [Pteronotus mesoamericanus]|uniref:lymphocyte antigen 6L n=1 Tax=Pteronotus mesoamericanus TaxID=1884717 RepID=UPI0023EC82E6|nr:lymphocyte antigen 6L [Pteronotus parnellii mesoamericanus]